MLLLFFHVIFFFFLEMRARKVSGAFPCFETWKNFLGDGVDVLN